jgi:hypothetical protein
MLIFRKIHRMQRIDRFGTRDQVNFQAIFIGVPILTRTVKHSVYAGEGGVLGVPTPIIKVPFLSENSFSRMRFFGRCPL